MSWHLKFMLFKLFYHKHHFLKTLFLATNLEIVIILLSIFGLTSSKNGVDNI